VYILDRDLHTVPVGVPGELFVGGAGVTHGYLRRPALTAERFVPDPFSGTPGARLYRSGDIARWLPGGVVELVGRNDHQVQIHGVRIELEEIEAALRQHPDVRQAVVVADPAVANDGVPDDEEGWAALVARVGAEGAEQVLSDVEAGRPVHAVRGDGGD
jgi:acyl-coenzyme A synthetase/AMP-(fatty) acid ligase